MVDAKLETKPGDRGLTYNGKLQELVTPGTTVDGIGTKPTASGAAGQTLGDIGFSVGGAASVPGKFAWEDGSIVPENDKEYNVIFTPEDTANYETVTFTILVTINSDPDTTDPGTVAVLVHDDGTRETVQKSIVEDGKISIPLDGSATVEIVDNSKEFDDVSPIR